MTCPSVVTGQDFLVRLLGHIDCQAQTLGSYGYQQLSAPGSLASLVLLGLLTLFVALFGIRLLFGPAPDVSDAVRDVLKLAIVLTLALSWPAWRTVVYDVVLEGPAEIASAIAAPSLPLNGEGGFAGRLQNIDTGMIALTVQGSGRNIGELTSETSSAAGFREIALEDDSGLAYARLFYLSSTISSLAIVRIAAGLLLALTPLIVGFLLFASASGLFFGWVRGLALTMLGSLGVTIMLAAEIAVLEPWLQDALRLRTLGYATPAAPTELLAMAAGFGIAKFGMLFVLARMAFYVSIPPIIARYASKEPQPSRAPTVQHSFANAMLAGGAAPSRAFQLSERMAVSVRQEDTARLLGSSSMTARGGAAERGPDAPAFDARPGNPHAGAKRNHRRISAAAKRRDTRS